MVRSLHREWSRWRAGASSGRMPRKGISTPLGKVSVWSFFMPIFLCPWCRGRKERYPIPLPLTRALRVCTEVQRSCCHASCNAASRLSDAVFLSRKGVLRTLEDRDEQDVVFSVSVDVRFLHLSIVSLPLLEIWYILTSSTLCPYELARELCC